MTHPLPKARSDSRASSAVPMPQARRYVPPIDADHLRRIFTPREPVTDDRVDAFALLNQNWPRFELTLGERLVLFFRRHGNGLTKLAAVALSVLCVVYVVAEAARVLR